MSRGGRGGGGWGGGGGPNAAGKMGGQALPWEFDPDLESRLSTKPSEKFPVSLFIFYFYFFLDWTLCVHVIVVLVAFCPFGRINPFARFPTFFSRASPRLCNNERTTSPRTTTWTWTWTISNNNLGLAHTIAFVCRAGETTEDMFGKPHRTPRQWRSHGSRRQSQKTTATITTTMTSPPQLSV